jgi:hypothetical protein
MNSANPGPAVPSLFDRKLYVTRQQKASAAAAPLYAHVAEELADRLGLVTRQFETALVVAPDCTDFETVLKASGKFGHVTRMQPQSSDTLGLEPESYHAALSILDLHTVNDVPGYLAQLGGALKPDGLLVLCFFAGETLSALRDAWLEAEVELTGGASPRVAPMIALRELGGLLQRTGLALPVADLDRLTLRHADGLALMREIKSFGFANAMVGRKSTLTSRRIMFDAAKSYHARNSDTDGRVRTTLELAWAFAWKPHPTQPQPLKPGSAKARLADALKVPEGKLGPG